MLEGSWPPRATSMARINPFPPLAERAAFAAFSLHFLATADRHRAAMSLRGLATLYSTRNRDNPPSYRVKRGGRGLIGCTSVGKGRCGASPPPVPAHYGSRCAAPLAPMASFAVCAHGLSCTRVRRRDSELTRLMARLSVICVYCMDVVARVGSRVDSPFGSDVRNVYAGFDFVPLPCIS